MTTALHIKLLVGAVAVLLTLGSVTLIGKGLYDKGYDAAEEACEKRAAAQIAAIRKELNIKSEEYEKLSRKADAVRTERTNTIREIYREIAAPPAVCAPDPRAVGVLDAALADANSAARR